MELLKWMSSRIMVMSSGRGSTLNGGDAETWEGKGKGYAHYRADFP